MTNPQFLIPNRGAAVRRGLLVLGSWLLMMVLACDENVEDYKREPNVYCVIRTDRDTASLMAGMTLGYFDSIPDSGRWNGTAGVVATVTHGESQTVFEELSGPVGFYRAAPVSIAPGASYRLLANYPAGAAVRGATTVPDTFGLYDVRLDSVFFEPWPGETLWSQAVCFRWSESRGAQAYFEASEAWYKAGLDSISSSFGSYPTAGRYDTLYISPFTYEWDSLTQTYDSLPLDRVALKIEAVDRNYYDYFMMGNAIGRERMWHLDGGAGVFGSVCLAETTFRFQPSDRH